MSEDIFLSLLIWFWCMVSAENQDAEGLLDALLKKKNKLPLNFLSS